MPHILINAALKRLEKRRKRGLGYVLRYSVEFQQVLPYPILPISSEL